jgi:uncharacterized protein (TIGR02145 family)
MGFLKDSISAAILLSCMVLAATSCNGDDDDDSTDYESFSGTLSFSCPSYVAYGDSDLVLTPTGAYREDGSDEYGYYWTASPIITSRDTTRYAGDDSSVDGTFTFEIPDTLCTVTFYCVIFADGYYSQTASKDVVIVNEKTSISMALPEIPTGTYTDPRDMTQYSYYTIGDYDWMSKNLEWDGAGVVYTEAECMRGIFGAYYTWNEAQTACPNGWELPDSTAWVNLASNAGAASPEGFETFQDIAGNLMGDPYFNGEKMWEFWPAVDITNSTGFSAMPTGYAYITGSDVVNFTGLDTYATFWTADESDDKGVYRYIFDEKPDVYIGAGDKDDFLANVRCVRER